MQVFKAELFEIDGLSDRGEPVNYTARIALRNS